jgi:hypothetical protein
MFGCCQPIKTASVEWDGRCKGPIPSGTGEAHEMELPPDCDMHEMRACLRLAFMLMCKLLVEISLRRKHFGQGL